MQNIVIDYKKCRSCGICEIVCPQKLIERHISGLVSVKPFESRTTVYCAVCLKCIGICPEKAITICNSNTDNRY